MVGIPAIVRNGRLDILYANAMGRALYSELYRDPRGPNHARFAFLDPRSRLFWADWEQGASDCVALLHAEAGRNPYDKALTDLVGELSTRSPGILRVRWAAHNVKNHRSGTKRLHHPLVGDLTLTFEALDLPADGGLAVMTYAAEPGSVSGSAAERAGAVGRDARAARGRRRRGRDRARGLRWRAARRPARTRQERSSEPISS